MTPILYVICLVLPFLHADVVIDKSQYEIVSDLKETCAANEYYLLDYKGPFPQCVRITSATSCNLCPPGYKCVGTSCAMDEQSCAVYHYQGVSTPSNRYTTALWKPKCLDDGTWAPKQCKGEPANGRCFCFSAYGERLHGHEWSWKAEKMTCACSRKHWELEQVMTDDDPMVSLHCDDWGNYEPLQCNSGVCWCAENMTGKILSKVVPEGMMEYLPCYNQTEIGSQYLRQCEGQLYGYRKIVAEFKIHGTNYQNFPVIKCRSNGGYGPYTIVNGIVYCVWKDNTNLGSWNSMIDPATIGDVNCNCGYDSKIFSMAGQAFTLACTASGNYEAKQTINVNLYCIDNDGFVKSPALVGAQVHPAFPCTNYK